MLKQLSWWEDYSTQHPSSSAIIFILIFFLGVPLAAADVQELRSPCGQRLGKGCHQVAWFTGIRRYPRLWSNWTYPSIRLVVKDDHITFTKVAGPGDQTRDLPNERPRPPLSVLFSLFHIAALKKFFLRCSSVA